MSAGTEIGATSPEISIQIISLHFTWKQGPHQFVPTVTTLGCVRVYRDVFELQRNYIKLGGFEEAVTFVYGYFDGVSVGNPS